MELFNMKRTLFLAILFVLISAPVYSADRSDLIRQYLDQSGMIKGLRGMFDMQAELTMKNMARNHNLSEAFQKDFREVWSNVMIDDFWSTGGFFDMLTPMFNEFTDNDLKEIVRFYKSPAGRKIANLTQEMQSYIRSIMPEWEQRISNVILPEMLECLEKRGWDKDGNKIQ